MMLLNPIGLRVAALLAACAALFAAGWTANGWRKDETIQRMRLAEAEAAKASVAAARAREMEYQTQWEKARNEAVQRENQLRAAADGARAESERLRGDNAAIRARLPGLAEAAVRRYADAAGAVFDECQRAYSDLAATADRIDDDRQTLMEAWPK